MGGSAFSFLKNPPFTPRMPPAVYRQVKQSCHAALRELFVYVATPIEGPGKQDHGDIDILVAQEKRCFFPKTASDTIPKSPAELLNEIKLLFAAEYCKITGPAANLAIRWPSSPSEDAEAEEGQKEKFIQVDVRICKDIDQVCWVTDPPPPPSSFTVTLMWLTDYPFRHSSNMPTGISGTFSEAPSVPSA